MAEESEAGRRQRFTKAFEGLRELSEQLEPFYAEQARQRGEAVQRLEARFADRGLKFTTPFAGDYPVQAHGHLDGLRFYFRYRWGGARLDLGPYERELEELHALRQREASARRLARRRAAGEEIDAEELRWHEVSSSAERIVEEDDSQFYPHRIVKRAHYEDPEGDGLKGELDAAEAEAFFAELVKTLEDVPLDQQLSERTRVLYYEGWDAVEAWDAAEKSRWDAQWQAKPKSERDAEIANLLAAQKAAYAKASGAAASEPQAE